MFGKINLKIFSPDKSKHISVEVNNILTVSQIIEELIQHKFISTENNYGILIEKNGYVISSNSTLNSISEDSDVRIVVLNTNKVVSGNRINVTILHPSNGMDMEVELSDRLSVDDVINELVACNFIEDSVDKKNYKLFVKNSQTEINGKQTLASGGTVDGSVLRVVI